MHTQLSLIHENTVIHYSEPTKQATPLACSLEDRVYATRLDNKTPKDHYQMIQMGDRSDCHGSLRFN